MGSDNTRLCQSPVLGRRGRDQESRARRRRRKQSPVKEETADADGAPDTWRC